MCLIWTQTNLVNSYIKNYLMINDTNTDDFGNVGA